MKTKINSSRKGKVVAFILGVFVFAGISSVFANWPDAPDDSFVGGWLGGVFDLTNSDKNELYINSKKILVPTEFEEIDQNKQLATKEYVDTLVSAFESGTAVGGVASGNPMPTMMSAKSISMHDYPSAIQYCRDLSSAPEYLYKGGSDLNIYNDWRLATIEEASLFVGISGIDNQLIWTRTQNSDSSHTKSWLAIQMQEGRWGGAEYQTQYYVRCVRNVALKNSLSNIPTMISEMSNDGYSWYSGAFAYCSNLSASPKFLSEGGTDTTTYDDWRVPTSEELSLFSGVFSDRFAWTRDVCATGDGDNYYGRLFYDLRFQGVDCAYPPNHPLYDGLKPKALCVR